MASKEYWLFGTQQRGQVIATFHIFKHFTKKLWQILQEPQKLILGGSLKKVPQFFVADFSQ